jgi:indolepyruvate ferredoxin oxidoreductase beta subunit
MSGAIGDPPVRGPAAARSRAFGVYLAGVGGQGIGLLGETLLRAADRAGLATVGCDTHGLAQRGGVVVSHIRIGIPAHAPLVADGTADLVVALERHEALRAARQMLRDGGTLVWYDAVWQPLGVRLGAEPEVSRADVEEEALRRRAAAYRVMREDLPDARMQNVAVLAEIARLALVPGVARTHYEEALADLLDGPPLERNLALFRSLTGA